MKAASVLAICVVVACDDSKPAPGDTSALPQNTIKASPDDTIGIGIDSTATAPASQPPPPVTGESPREVPPVSRDPMPPLTGETSKQGGTMPVYRDSASGPKMEIDSKGRIVPIKKD